MSSKSLQSLSDPRLAVKASRNRFKTAWREADCRSRARCLVRIFGSRDIDVDELEEIESTIFWEFPFEVEDMIFEVSLECEGPHVKIKDEWLKKAGFPKRLEERSLEAWSRSLDTLTEALSNQHHTQSYYLVWSETAMLASLGWRIHEHDELYEPNIKNVELISWLTKAVGIVDIATRWPTLGPWLKVMHEICPPSRENPVSDYNWMKMARNMYIESHARHASLAHIELPALDIVIK